MDSVATALLLLADARLPAGGHAHSGGLEAAVAAGLVTDLAGLRGFLSGRLATAGLVGAAFAAAACARLADGADPPPAGRAGRVGADRPVPADLAELDSALDARTPSPALRRVSRQQGRALLRAGRAMWPAIRVAELPGAPHHPVALGAVAAGAGLDHRQAAAVAAYAAVSGPASAAVRLLGLDPYGVYALLADLADDCDRVAQEAAGHAAAAPADLPAAGAPLLDISAEHHATWEVRLFAS
jgi:urease accessory protein